MIVDLNILEVYKLHFMVSEKLKKLNEIVDTFSDFETKLIVMREINEYEDILRRLATSLE